MKQHTALNLIRAICGVVVMLALAASIPSVPAFAAPNGIYTATAAPHYKHPITGKVDDAGGEGSAVLGQSMTESATHKKALVEIDPSGNTFITVRIKLMDNIQNPEFQVDGSPVSATLMQEDYTENTADYRMQVKDENSVIRCNMYVVPMGREVIFFITVSNLQPGSEDFIADIGVRQPETDAPQTTERQIPQTTDLPETDAPAETDVTETEAPQTEPEITTAAPSAAEDTEAVSTTVAEKEDTALGLQEFDQNGNRVEQREEESGSNAKKTEPVFAVWWILGGIAVTAAVAGCIWYCGFFRKKK